MADRHSPAKGSMRRDMLFRTSLSLWGGGGGVGGRRKGVWGEGGEEGRCVGR